MASAWGKAWGKAWGAVATAPVSLGKRSKIARTRTPAMVAADAEVLALQEAADLDARDMRDLQEVVAALFTFKGIF